MMRSPNDVKAYWFWGILFYFLLPITNIQIIGDSGSPPGMVIMGMFTIMAILSPIVFSLIYYGSKKYKGSQKLFKFSKKFVLLDIALLLPIIFSIISVYADAIDFYIIPLIHWILILWYIMVVRVSIISKFG